MDRAKNIPSTEEEISLETKLYPLMLAGYSTSSATVINPTQNRKQALRMPTNEVWLIFFAPKGFQ